MIAREQKASLIAARPGLFVVLAVVLGALLLGAALFWDRVPTRRERRTRIADAVDVVVPPPLTEEETRAGGAGGLQERVALESGAWVQVADADGRLQQRYRATRLDPEPDRWVRMEQPHAIMYPSDGRVMIMRADHGRARVPKRALQAGRLTGNVEIKIYRAKDGERVRFKDDEPINRPAMIILSDEAQFDEVLGEIRCDGWVDVWVEEEAVVEGRSETRTITFKGEGLLIGIDPEPRTVERLFVEKPLTPIVITKTVKEVDRASAAVAADAAVAGPGGGAVSSATNGAVAAEPAATGAKNATTRDTKIIVGGAEGTAAASVNGDGSTTVEVVVAPTAPSAAAAADARPFRLTLNDNVSIHRVADGRETTIRGDKLIAVFSLQSSGLRDALAGMFPVLPTADDFDAWRFAQAGPMTPPGWLSLPWAGRLAVLSLAAPAQKTPEPRGGDERITIRYEGRLVMVPAEDAGSELASPEDVVLIIDSDPRGARQVVEIEDVRTLARARCERLVYRGFDESVELDGSVRQPLEVESPRMALEGGRFRFERRTGRGEIPGQGRMKLGDRERSASEAAAKAQAPAAGAPKGSPESGAQSGGGLNAAARSATPPIPARDLEITWQDRLNIELEDETKGSRIKSAHFQGAVVVDHVDFALRSKGLRVLFGPGKGGDADATVQAIIADGGARAERLSESGTLAARIIFMELAQDDAGRITPKTLTARGGVEAADKSQTMWSDDLKVDFEPRKTDGTVATGPNGADGNTGALALGDEMGDVEATTIRAGTLPDLDSVTVDGISLADPAPAEGRSDGGVQILLRDGARVFAQRLEGDARERHVKLYGPDVMIVHRNVVADQLDHLDIDEAKGTVTAEGPGRFRHFREPVVDSLPSPRMRPDPKGAVGLDATWKDRMHFSDRANDGGGSIDLIGGVKVRASRTDREFSALDAQTVQLDLRNDPNAKTARPQGAGEGAALGTSSDPELLSSGTRSIQRLIAKNDARLENQTWATDARIGEPRLFRVTGNHIEYDTVTGEAKVVGEGSLLVHDTTEKPAGAGGAATPDARGTTRFKWGSSMDMTRLGSQRFLVVMNDGVEVLHTGLQPTDTFTVTCRTLETTLLRPGFGDSAPAKAAPSDAASGQLAKSADVDLGGSAEVQRIRAIGQVMVRAPEADIECEDFDYDVRTQIAQIKSREGRLVTVLRRDNPTPIRATSVIWDRTTGRMTIQSGSGAIGR